MIKNNFSMSMVEATDYLKGSKDEGKEMKGFIKKFVKIKPAKAKELRKKLISLEMIKLDENNISKIIDMLPENAEEVNKIFVGMSLDEEETKKVLDIVKEFK